MAASASESVKNTAGKTVAGALSGRPVFIPDVNVPPMPSIAPPGPIYNGKPTDFFDAAKLSGGHPDACSYRRRFGLIIPATNTTMESELWNILARNCDNGLDGIGLHTSTVLTPKPMVDDAAGLETFKRQFLGGIKTSVDSGLLARPQYFIMGCSLEHMLVGLDAIRANMAEVETYSPLSWASWHEAVQAAFRCYRVKRVGILTPWERLGNSSAVRMFEDMGVEVVASVGLSCASIQHIAHLPNEAKEKAVLELLATKENKLDAVVQCGTNMSMTAVAEKLEPQLRIPIFGINATILWYALRENGFTAPVLHAGRLLREF
jgi:maleate isomerase